MDVLPKRFAKYGLTLHPVKTRLIDFRRPAGPNRRGKGGSQPRPSTFALLGFTHYWGRSRRGEWVVKRKTSTKSFRRAVRAIALWCRRFRHMPLRWQHRMLIWKLNGHYSYYGITGNGRALGRFLQALRRIWRKWLSRRSQRAQLWWGQFQDLLHRYPLPRPRVVHSVYRHAAKPWT